MFLPVLLITLYVVISRQFFMGQTLEDVNIELATKFSDGEITKIGWIPVMALCVTISGFIIFFRNCRPFTTFRKILYFIILGVVLLVLLLAPEFFIVSGTEMLKQTGGILKIFPYIFSHIASNASLTLFRTMTLEQLIFLICFAVAAIPLYLLNEKVFGGLVEFTLFSKREFKDE